MKKWCLIFILFCSCLKSKAQVEEAEQLLLNVEKLAQLRNILSDLKKGYQVLFEGYTTIKNISEGNFMLHDLFLDNLLQVSPVVKKYKRITDIITCQLRLVQEYKRAWQQLREANLLNPDEITYVGRVYSRLIDQTAQNLEALAMVITAEKLRMSDDERLSAIDGIWKDMQDKLTFLRHFNNESKILLLQRAKEKGDVETLKQIYTPTN